MSGITRSELRGALDEAHGHLVVEGWSREDRQVLVVLTHEYRLPSQQQHLYAQAEVLLARFPGAEVMVEEMVGARARPTFGLFGSAIKQPARRQAEALKRLETKGVLAGTVLADLHPHSVTISGADDQDSLDRQRKCLREIEAAVVGALPAAARGMTSGQLLTALQVEMEEAAERLGAALNPRLQQLLALKQEFTTNWGPSAYARGLAAMAGDEGIATDGYPALHALVTSVEEESRLDFDRVEQERMGLIQQIVEHSEAADDPRRGRALVQWMDTSPVPEGTVLSRQEMLAGPAWFGRLIALSKAYGSQRMTMAKYMRTLENLLEALEIPVNPGSALGRYIRYVTMAERISLNDLLEEDLPGLFDELADVHTRSAMERGVLELQRRADDLGRFLTLELPASRVRGVLSGNRSPARWVDEALRVGDTALGHEWLDQTGRRVIQGVAAAADRASDGAGAFHELALARSELMITRALRSSAPLTILICGRFHVREALRVLRANPPVSWAVFAGRAHPRPPRVDARLSIWNWAFPGSEWSLSEGLPGAV